MTINHEYDDEPKEKRYIEKNGKIKDKKNLNRISVFRHNQMRQIFARKI